MNLGTHLLSLVENGFGVWKNSKEAPTAFRGNGEEGLMGREDLSTVAAQIWGGGGIGGKSKKIPSQKSTFLYTFEFDAFIDVCFD